MAFYNWLLHLIYIMNIIDQYAQHDNLCLMPSELAAHFSISGKRMLIQEKYFGILLMHTGQLQFVIWANVGR